MCELVKAQFAQEIVGGNRWPHGPTEAIRIHIQKMQDNLLKAHTDLTTAQAEIAELQGQVERYRARDGNATMTLCYSTEAYPFNHEELKIIDFGVSDNGYMVESDMFSKMVAALEPVTKLSKYSDLTNHEVSANIIDGAKAALNPQEG